MILHCSVCGASVSGSTFQSRMGKLRRHYKFSHPRLFKKQIRKAVATRKRNLL